MWASGRGQQELVAARVRAVLAAQPPARVVVDRAGLGAPATLTDAEVWALFAEDEGSPAAAGRPVPAAFAAHGAAMHRVGDGLPAPPVPPAVARRAAHRVGEDRTAPDDRSAAAQPDVPPEGPTLVDRLLAGRPIHARAGRRSAVAVGVAALVAALLTGWWVFASRPQSIAAPTGLGPLASAGSGSVGSAGRSGPAPSSAEPSGSSSGTALSPASGQLLVDVEGRVRRPGLYRLPAGARIADAVAAAGGARAHVTTTTLNLAARLSDGQQIVVGASAGSAAPAGAAGGAATPSAPASTGPAAPVSLNAAGLDELQTLPGVGPVLAQHIVDWRTEHGGFTSVDQLNDVAGIGDVKFAALRGLVSL